MLEQSIRGREILQIINALHLPSTRPAMVRL